MKQQLIIKKTPLTGRIKHQESHLSKSFTPEEASTSPRGHRPDPPLAPAPFLSLGPRQYQKPVPGERREDGPLGRPGLLGVHAGRVPALLRCGQLLSLPFLRPPATFSGDLGEAGLGQGTLCLHPGLHPQETPAEVCFSNTCWAARRRRASQDPTFANQP